MKKRKPKRKNPDSLVSAYEKILKKYDDIFQHLWAGKYWNRCKSVIMYYFTLLYGINNDLAFATQISNLDKFSLSPSLIHKYLEIQYVLTGKTGKKFQQLTFILGNIKRFFSDSSVMYSEKRLDTVKEYLKVLEINYLKFREDIAICRRLNDDSNLSQTSKSLLFDEYGSMFNVPSYLKELKKISEKYQKSKNKDLIPNYKELDFSKFIKGK